MFKDINSGYYFSKPEGLYAATYDELEAVCGKYNIVSSAMGCRSKLDYPIKETNSKTIELCKGSGGSNVPVLHLLPPAYEKECYSKEELRTLVEQEHALFRVFPVSDGCCFTEWVYDWMLDILEESDTPVLASLEEIDLRDAAAVLQAHPRLPLILTNSTQWMNRQYMRFLQAFDNAFIDTSNIIEYYGIENLVKIIGAGKVLFGTNMPDKEPYDKLFQIMRSEISQEERDLIAFGNYERLVERVA